MKLFFSIFPLPFSGGRLLPTAALHTCPSTYMFCFGAFLKRLPLRGRRRRSNPVYEEIEGKRGRTFYVLRPVHGLKTGRGSIFRPVLGGKTSGPTEKDVKRLVPPTRTGRFNKTSGPPFVAGVTWVHKVGQRPEPRSVCVHICIYLLRPAFNWEHTLHLNTCMC